MNPNDHITNRFLRQAGTVSYILKHYFHIANNVYDK